jgi:hypothetical protein
LARSQPRHPACAWRRVRDTYVGTWRKRFRITAGEREINRFEEKETGAVHSFCRRCGTPLIYERTRSRHIINIPGALFQSRTGRQPIYHIAIEEMQDWVYAGEPLVPLKGYPRVFCKRSKKRKSRTGGPPLSIDRVALFMTIFFHPRQRNASAPAYAASHRYATASTACGATHSQIERPSAVVCHIVSAARASFHDVAKW